MYTVNHLDSKIHGMSADTLCSCSYMLEQFKMSVKVSATFTSQLLSNHTAKMTKFSIKNQSMVICSFLKFGLVKFLKTSHNVPDVKSL